MDPADDLERLRRRREARRPSPPPPPAPGPPAFVGRVASLAANIHAQSFVLVNPVTVLGAEAEGGAGSLAVDASRSIPVLLLGSRLPATGDDLVVRRSAHRWEAEVGGAPSGLIALPGCLCRSIPPTFYQHSSRPLSNGGMFQDDTITYGPTPAAYAGLGLPANGFYGAGSWPDQYGDDFRYYLTCNVSNFTLSRVYVTSIFGSPYLDSVRYSWSFGASGNTCVPWSLTNGRIYFGGDSSCVVTLNTTS